MREDGFANPIVWRHAENRTPNRRAETFGVSVTRRTGPLARVNLFRVAIFAVILGTAILAFTLQVGVFRFMFRTALVVGVVLLFGSYLVERWLKRHRHPHR